jgi:uncharacterized membrane protein YraQ (UPF0718 family)
VAATVEQPCIDPALGRALLPARDGGCRDAIDRRARGRDPDLIGGSSGIAAFALAAVVGIPLYVWEGEEVTWTYALTSTGLGAGPAFTFLLGSVGTCIPTIVMSRGIVGSRATYFYLCFWIAFALAAGVAFGAITG